MSLYPTLEDMKVDQIQKAEIAATHGVAKLQRRISEESAHGQYPTVSIPHDLASCYPSLMEEYMGLQFEPPTGPYQVVPHGGQQVAIPSSHGTSMMVAPLSGNDAGMAKANVTHGVREVVLCQDGAGKVGLRLRDVNKGVFVQFVGKNTPASLAGLRFGDQLLQVDGKNVAGVSGDKAMEIVKKAKNPQRIVLAVRDRPFERTVTLHKDSSGHVGFTHKGGKITNIAKETSAARNGLLVEHHILEANGQNVVGLTDKERGKIIDECGQIVTLTIMPSFVYDHMVKCMGDNLIKKMMDHSIPEV